MDSNMPDEERMDSRLWWLMFSRIAIVSFLLGIAAFIQVKMAASISPASLYSVYLIIGITYSLSIFQVFLLRKIRNTSLNVNIQSLTDVLLITILVYVTGGIESTYSSLYPLVIIYSVLFLGRRGGILIASVSAIMYGLLLDLEFYNVIHPLYSVVYKFKFSAAYVFSRIFIYIVSFYIIALLASFVVESEKKTRALLSEKESAFDKLDLLHKIIIESVDTGIMTIDLQDRIKSFNRAAELITGYTFYEIRDQYIQDVFSNISETPKSRINGENRFELEVASKDGKPMILGFSTSPLVESGGEGIGRILIFQDLTSLKEMEEEVERSKRLAVIGEMAAVLAHELRNPLASLSGSIQILQRDLALKGTDKKLMEIILRGKDQLENLVKDFLLFARPTPGERSVIDVKDVIGDIVESVRYGPDWNEDIEIETTLCDSNEVYANKSEIRQALWNIISNALQSMPDGGHLKIETAAVSDVPKGEFLEICIADTGFGIAKECQDRVLEPFYTTKEKGTGLGLAIVNRVIESHDGIFRLESEVNKGSTCTIVLPRESKRRS